MASIKKTLAKAVSATFVCDLFVACSFIVPNRQLWLFVLLIQSAKGMEGYVGFANLPNQVFRKSVKKGFEFTIMVAGRRTVFVGTALK